MPVTVTVHDSESDEILATQDGTTGAQIQLAVDSPKLWSPDTPNLYNVTVRMGSDEVQSYTGFRTISKGIVDGVMRPLLNGEFLFTFATLDQGYWPDGLYTPPSREAMVYDLEVLKKLGFNMVRKHVSSCAEFLNFRLYANVWLQKQDQNRKSFVLSSMRSNGLARHTGHAISPGLKIT